MLLWPVPLTYAKRGRRWLRTSPRRRLLYVARLEAHKNHLRLLDACETLWRQGLNFRLRLIGCLAYPDTAWKILGRVRALQRAGFAVQWQAHVPEDELHAAYRDCTATAFPSLSEGFGLPILESLWHGRPVVCGNNGALGEVAAGGGCEMVDTRETASITAGLRRLLSDEAHYRTLYTASQNRRFRTWSDYWAEVSDFLQS